MKRTFLMTLLSMLTVLSAQSQELYEMPEGVRTRWTSFENPAGEKGAGGLENRGAKGHAFETVKPGQSVTLADIQGAGVIQRMWMTVNRRAPSELRAFRIQMYWDGSDKPAVDVPLADFFGAGLARLVPYENVFFASPEGRSFNVFVPMPFRTAARVVFTNESGENVDLFYDINYNLVDDLDDDVLYFHAHWRRENPTTLGQDYEVLPRVTGRGRFLGTNIGVITDSTYRDSWWGEGEVKMYLDGDTDLPTLIGSGAEDYIGTGWGQGTYVNQFQGALVGSHEDRQWSFYRYHVPDPVYFYEDIRVTLQQIGGWPRPQVAELIQNGAELQPVTIDAGGRDRFQKFLEMESAPDVTAEDFPDGWVNFYRSDDVSSTAYFYLDRPSTDLPDLPSIEARTAGVSSTAP